MNRGVDPYVVGHYAMLQLMNFYRISRVTKFSGNILVVLNITYVTYTIIDMIPKCEYGDHFGR